jgi:hypothetical protein
LVCRGDEPTDTSVHRLAPKARDHAARGLAERDPAGEVHAVTQIPIGYVGSSATGRHPRKRECGGHHARPEALGEPRVSEQSNRAEHVGVGVGPIEVDVHELESAEGFIGSSTPSRRTRARCPSDQNT